MFKELQFRTKSISLAARVTAMNGNLSASIETLDRYLRTAAIPALDRAYLFLIKAELLYYNGDNDDSIKVIQEDIGPVIKELPAIDQMVIYDNEFSAALNSKSSDSIFEYYSFQQLDKQFSFKIINFESLLSVQKLSAENKHYEAYPIVWRNYLDAFESGSWRLYKITAEALAIECLALNSLSKAAYYAIHAFSEKLIQDVAGSMLSNKDDSAKITLIKFILRYFNLKKHASFACIFLFEMSDSIPDACIGFVFNWLSTKANIAYDGNLSANHDLFKNAWTAIQAIAWRLSPKDAVKLQHLAIQHPVWESVNPDRIKLIETMNILVDVLPSAELQNLAEKSLPLVTAMKSDIDYIAAVNLLCQIAKKADNLKRSIGDVLFNQEKIPSKLFHVAELFDRQDDIVKPKISQFLNSSIRNISLMVQKVEKAAIAESTFDTFGQISNKTSDEKTTVVQMFSGSSLNSLIRHVKLLSDLEVSSLIAAILDLIANKDNILSNKCILVDSLSKIVLVCSGKDANLIFDALMPMARGEISEGEVGMSFSESSNPLNPFKLSYASPDDLAASCLICLSYLFLKFSEKMKKQLLSTIEESIISSNPVIRVGAYIAAALLPEVSEKCITGLLFGTRDNDESVATSAFDAIAYKKGESFEKNHWSLFLYSIREVLNSKHLKLRQKAVIAISNLCPNIPSEMAGEMNDVLKLFKEDPCYSVRHHLNNVNNVLVKSKK